MFKIFDFQAFSFIISNTLLEAISENVSSSYFQSKKTNLPLILKNLNTNSQLIFENLIITRCQTGIYIYFLEILIIFIFGKGDMIFDIKNNLKGTFFLNSSELSYNAATPIFNIEDNNYTMILKTKCFSTIYAELNNDLSCYFLKNNYFISIEKIEIINCFSSKNTPGIVIFSNILRKSFEFSNVIISFQKISSLIFLFNR